MSESVLLRKCCSAYYHAREGWKRIQERRRAADRRSSFNAWLKQLKASKPDVLVGANFAAFGGTRNHIHAVKAFSKLNIAIVPDDESLKKITEWSLTTEFREAFLLFQPEGVRAVHSHVFPWFIEWCHHQQQANGLRWIHTHHNWYYPEFSLGELEPWQTEFNEQFLFALRHADVCLSVSKGQQDFLKTTFGLETRYLPNGVNVELCDVADAKRFRNKVGIDPFILYVGRNDPVKNPVEFVNLAVSLPTHQFLMIGQGLSTDAMLDDWGVATPTNLKIVGEATHGETQDAIAACTAMVVTSKREGLPTIVLEAMTHRKPLVVPDEAGCMEAIGNGDFGFIYHQGDIDDLAAMTLRAVSDNQKCDHARQRVLAEYDWRVVARKLDQIYKENA